MASICARLDRIKDDPTGLFDSHAIERACREHQHHWRNRTLNPLSTLAAFAIQVMHRNTALSYVARLMSTRGKVFSAWAYCQARTRLPVAVVRAAFEDFTTRARGGRASSDGLWCGHRTALIDGTGVSTPDTPELRAAFGVSSNCKDGAGLPLIHTLTIFDAHDGLLLDLHTSPAHTHDLRHAHDLHPALTPGDVLVGDRGFASYIHLHRLTTLKCHGVMRISASWKIPFPARSGERTRHTYNRHRRHEPILIELHDADDQTIEIVKPHNRPDHVTPEEFAQIPATMTVRAVRYTVEKKGVRTRQVTLLSTLLDAKKYPAKALADLYETRWRIEVNLRHLKRTMDADRLRCQSVDGVQRELLMFALIYNAVCSVRAGAARVAQVAPTRLSFVDALRVMLIAARDGPAMPTSPPTLMLVPSRPPRVHPRQLKRAHSNFKVMDRSRTTLVDWMNKKCEVAN